MDNLRAVIKNLFCYVPPQELLTGKVQYDKISKDLFQQLGSGYISRYSNDELINMYHFLETEFWWQNKKLKGEVPFDEKQGKSLNVFDALVAFEYAVLIEENGVPLCQYSQLLRWRDMITALEEDLFIASYFAYKDILNGKKRKNFFWKPVIGHNNRALNRLVSKGVAENHFHLKGSAPHFHLSWISLMNQPDKQEFAKELNKYEENRLQKNLELHSDVPSGKLSYLWRQAVLIRVFLFSVLKGDCLSWRDVYVPANVILEAVSGSEFFDEALRTIERSGPADTQKVRLDSYRRYLGEKARDIEWRCTVNKVGALLKDDADLANHAGVIQENIDRFQRKYAKRDLDYMICEGWLAYNGPADTNGPLSGERWFLYRMFKAVYAREAEFEPYINWFYLYLIIKANIGRELVQANANVGFDNFLRYQNRKDVFVENSIYEKVYIRMAVRDTIYNQHIKSLEARIVPKRTVDENIRAIRKYDSWITDALDDEREKRDLQEKYFYVYHFVKDSERIERSSPDLEKFRHYAKRREIKEQALAIAGLRESGVPESARIKGIDAASPEIWCRPEVFAQAFRFLKNHWVESRRFPFAETECSTLLATYHVGEDFLDILDGLRAIDEAILFLNLRCGDRLGHALALGVDIDEWYESKSNRILINKMGYLDNLVWIYGKLRQFNIAGCDEVKTYIEKRFHEYFLEIYENNMKRDMIESVIRQAEQYYDKHGIKHNYGHDMLSFNIDGYYDAWKLRGDAPELYEDGYFKIHNTIMDEWDEYALNSEFPLNYRIRYVPETALLYHLYHFNPDVKIAGDEMVEIKIRPCIIEAVKKVREAMQREICRMGIAIETNPSSNYLIGTFRRYDKHPIIQWYNYGLTLNQEELQRCPQMQVSINTDDQGVFSTYIENEYAYLALALEKRKDENGNFAYNRTMILQWLDHIRLMGIDQSFWR